MECGCSEQSLDSQNQQHQQEPIRQELSPQTQHQQLVHQASTRPVTEAPYFYGGIRQDLKIANISHEASRVRNQDPSVNPAVRHYNPEPFHCDCRNLFAPLLLLYCEGSSAHTVLQRGDYPRIPKEVRDDTAIGGEGFHGGVFRYLLPPTPVVFEPPIDVNKSGCKKTIGTIFLYEARARYKLFRNA
ncbi:hypothetical protein, conserved [Eimeria tenella]|uniref:Uncharacterized protein n=1 Tax=Eimeria tenella TaxID=5802 RepID=U6KYC4_EIMTE|nr:hypothetical protein, conserved [Eimeria tenella]CDJ40485.1 hypothetical protein, conserved [Eimeria tenella]|eukprot:XP_013231235.1 hypothetical protein, conserved [Eimeria tenella]